MNETESEQLKNLLQKAEDDVSVLKDESLRKTAFELILKKGLGISEIQENVHKEKNIKRASKRQRTGDSALQKKEVSPSTTLKLDEMQLKELKKLYEERQPKGEEGMVFTLCLFCTDTLKMSTFCEADIFYLYDSLLAVKPSNKPLATDKNKLRRALNWLVAPSRKKMWLSYETSTGMYKLSPHGKLQTYDKPSAGNGNN